MSNYSEQIEAKLCSYIDDELKGAERAEIERYLAENPQHRELVEELRQTRRVLQALRHEPAPPEIIESIESQIERSVLLGEAEQRGVILRIEHWPQFTAAAAMLLLALGLAYIVVKMLPPMHPVEVATPLQLPPVASSDSRSAAVAEPGTRLPDVLSKGSEHPMKGYGKAGNAKDGDTVSAADVAAARKMFQDSPEKVLKEVDESFKSASFNGRIVMIVDTADPAMTNSAAKGYLRSNNFQWEEKLEPMPDALKIAQNQTAMATKMNTVNVQPSMPKGTVKKPTTVPVPSVPSAPGAEDRPDRDLQLATKDGPAGLKQEDKNAPADGRDRTTPGAASQARGGDEAEQAQQARPQSAQVTNYETRIVVRNIPRSQVAELTQNLSRQQAVRSSRVFENNDNAAGIQNKARFEQQKIQADSGGWVAVGPALDDREQQLRRREYDRDRVAVEQRLGGDGGASRPSQDAKKLDNEKEAAKMKQGDTMEVKVRDELRELKVAEDGAVELPGARRLKVEGMNVEEAKRAVAEALKPERKDLTDAKDPAATTMPATAPTTAPATRPAAEGEDNLDVIIVVQSDVAPAVAPAAATPTPAVGPVPSTAPATRPVEPDPAADFKPAD